MRSFLSILARRIRGVPPSYARWGIPLCALSLCLLGGCAYFKQVQYFEAVGEPDANGVATRQFYRVTITGGGHLVKKYNMNAAYLSGAAIESLQGSKPRIPIVDTPAANAKAFDAIKAQFLDALQDYAKTMNTQLSGSPSGKDQERRLVAIARQAWMASLSDSDLCSMGQFKTADGHAFRRLIFWTSAEDVDLSKYSDKINAAIDNVETLAEQFKAKHDAEVAAEKEKSETAAAERKQRQQQNLSTMKALVNNMSNMDTSLKTALIAILDGAMSSTSTASSTTTSSDS